MSEKVLMYGASGFVGSGLASILAERGFTVTGVTRKEDGDVRGVSHWVKPEDANPRGFQIIVNLAGAPVDQRWTEENKRQIRESRVNLTKDLVAKIADLPEPERPSVLLNSSAVGYYGGRGDEILTEKSAKGSGYLADLCADWEAAAEQAEGLGVRVITFRTGVVLGKGGQAYEKLLTVFKIGIGGRLGDGKQWMPWIHVDDLRQAMVFSIDSKAMHGPVNGTAPEPERNKDLTKKLAKSVHRWEFFPVPGFMLKLVLGGFGGALLDGQRAIPEKLTAHGFDFKFPTLEAALENLTSNE